MPISELTRERPIKTPEIQLRHEEQAFAQDCLSRSRGYLASNRLYKKLTQEQQEYLALATASYMANIPSILAVYKDHLLYSMGIYDEHAYQDQRKLQDVELLIQQAEIKLSPYIPQGIDHQKFYSNVFFSLMSDAHMFARLHPNLPEAARGSLERHAGAIGTLLPLRDVASVAGEQIGEVEKRFRQTLPLPLQEEVEKLHAA